MNYIYNDKKLALDQFMYKMSKFKVLKSMK